MQKELDKDITISVIIPCYNAQKYIGDTISSVLNQSEKNLELICVNDGSTDDSENIILTFKDDRLKYIKKTNTGVSDSRNKGFEASSGKYILFLDADDILSEDFLRKRIEFLTTNPEFGFCCSEVIKIDESGNKNLNTKWRGAYSSILEEVLSYNLKIITCPSNYLFRREVLDKNHIRFNSQLSSSADRFFLIELSHVAKCGWVEDSYLYYRMHASSMSHNLTPDLLKDNILFKQKILAIEYIPVSLKKEFNFKTNYILAGSYLKLGKIIPFIKYSLRSFYYNPGGFLKQLTK